MRGEFHCANGLVLPNNITSYGAQILLAAAIRNEVPSFFVGLVDAVPDPALLIASVLEPQFVDGYERKQVSRDAAGWPVTGTLNGETWYETGWLTWVATAPFTVPIRRMMLVGSQTNVGGDMSEKNLKVLALSSALPSALTITPDTPEADRKFKYRLYAR